jgi:hypothetical protein
MRHAHHGTSARDPGPDPNESSEPKTRALDHVARYREGDSGAGDVLVSWSSTTRPRHLGRITRRSGRRREGAGPGRVAGTDKPTSWPAALILAAVAARSQEPDLEPGPLIEAGVPVSRDVTYATRSWQRRDPDVERFARPRGRCRIPRPLRPRVTARAIRPYATSEGRTPGARAGRRVSRDRARGACRRRCRRPGSRS